MALYKVKKCKEKAFNTHDKRICMYWHSKSDRRRNPFEIPYACTECANNTETATCSDGDKCLRAHNMLERMFHPELYKITICQQGSKCERGKFCAFAHSDEDRRIPQSHSKGALEAGSLEHIQPGKLMSDSKLLDTVQDKLVRLIKAQGTEGIISSELPKRYYEIYSERLELTDEAGEKFRIKDLLLSHAHISVSMHKGVQPKYVYTEEAVESSELDARMIPIDDVPLKKDVPSTATAADMLNHRRRGPSSPLTIDLSMDPTAQQPTSSYNFSAPSDKSVMNGLGFNSIGGGFNGMSLNQNQLGGNSL